MAYKGKSVVVASASHLITELKDFLLTCGWTLDGPSTNPAAHDDDEGLILGWFLKSDGEDSAQDIHIHLGVSKSYWSNLFAKFDYLAESGGITDTTTDFAVQDGTLFYPGGKYRIEDEIFVVGTVDGNVLRSCQRGWGITSPASHAQNKVIQAIEDDDSVAYLLSEIYAFRDFTTPMLTSNSPSSAWASSSADFSGDSVLDNSGYWGDDRFNYHCLIENVTDGKMRWITNYVASNATFTHQKFLSNPASSQAKIWSGGFLPGWSKRATTTAYGNARRHLGIWAPFTQNWTLPSSYPFHQEAGTVVWMYGSKDGVMLVAKWPTLNYQAFYIGNCISHSSPLTTTLSASANAGDTTLNINNTDIFTSGQKIRIISQSTQDWSANEDRSSESPAGSWPNLDVEEIPTEEVVVQSVGTGTITISSGLKYSYSSAVLGEDPRPAIRMGNYDGKDADRSKFISARTTFVACYAPTPKDQIGSHASHRQYSRAFHNSGTPYSPLWMDGNNGSPAVLYALLGMSHNFMFPTGDYVMDWDPVNGEGNYQNDQLPMQRYVVHANDSTIASSYGGNGIFCALKGFLPFCWVNTTEQSPYGGLAEDTLKALWSGKFETFRYFYINATWPIFGPEIP